MLPVKFRRLVGCNRLNQSEPLCFQMRRCDFSICASDMRPDDEGLTMVKHFSCIAPSIALFHLSKGTAGDAEVDYEDPFLINSLECKVRSLSKVESSCQRNTGKFTTPSGPFLLVPEADRPLHQPHRIEGLQQQQPGAAPPNVKKLFRRRLSTRLGAANALHLPSRCCASSTH